MERLRHSIGFAMASLQALTLINGGALVALFTFVGSSTAVRFDMSALWVAFAAFATGLVFNLLAFLGAHLSQDYFYVSAQWSAWNAELRMDGLPESYDAVSPARIGTRAQIAGIASGIVSLIAFIVGCGFALSGVTGG
ncbi:hypothetical protein [Sphingobium aromaticiconvertens]|uniref:hypothetical protein n=1 Tax=Sphingobium aromaticiconvertens TaxID=365341 RepID=UPI0030177A46